MHAAVVELNSLADAVGPSSQDHDLAPTAARSLIGSIVCGVIVIFTFALIIKRKRGKLRKIIPAVLGYSLLTIGIGIVSFTTISAYGFCSGKVLVNQVASEEYYNQIYKTFHTNTQTTLEAAGFPKETLDSLLDERTIYLDGKLALESTFNSGRSRKFMDVQPEIKQEMLKYLVKEQYTNVADISDELGNLAGLIQVNYTDSLKFSYADKMVEVKKTVQKKMLCLGLTGVGMTLLGLITLIFSQKYIHRIFRLFGWSSITIALSTLSGSIYYLIMNASKDLGLVQAEYSHFFSSYMRWNAQLLIAGVGLEILIFACCTLITMSLRKIHKHNPLKKIG